MSESKQHEGEYAPGTYVKGDESRVAYSAADAVALVFRGFALQAEPEVETEEVEEPAPPAEKPTDNGPAAKPSPPADKKN